MLIIGWVGNLPAASTRSKPVGLMSPSSGGCTPIQDAMRGRVWVQLICARSSGFGRRWHTTQNCSLSRLPFAMRSARGRGSLPLKRICPCAVPYLLERLVRVVYCAGGVLVAVTVLPPGFSSCGLIMVLMCFHCVAATMITINRPATTATRVSVLSSTGAIYATKAALPTLRSLAPEAVCRRLSAC